MTQTTDTSSMSKAQTLPADVEKRFNGKFDHNGGVMLCYLESFIKEFIATELSNQKAEMVGELKMGLLGIITSVSYSMKLSDGQVTVLNRQINDLLDTLNEGKG